MGKARYIGTIKCLLQEIDFNIKDLLKRYTEGDNSYKLKYFYKIKEYHTVGEKTVVTADIFVTEGTSKENDTSANNNYYAAEADIINKVGQSKNINKVQFYLNAVSNILLPISTFILFNGWIYHREFLMLSNYTIAINATYLTIIVSLLGLLSSLLFLRIDMRSILFHVYILNFGVFSLCLYRTLGEDSLALYAFVLLITVLIGVLAGALWLKSAVDGFCPGWWA